MEGWKIGLIAAASVVAVLWLLITVFAYALLCYIAKRGSCKPLDKIGESIKRKEHDAGRADELNRARELKRAELEAEPELRELHITGLNGVKLTAHLLGCGRRTDKVVLFCHGHRCDGLTECAHWAYFYAERGYDVLMIDHRACGKSEGRYMTFGCKESKDAYIWLNEVYRRYGDEVKIAVHGISMGAATALMMSGENAGGNVKCFVAESSYTSAWNEYAYIMKNKLGIPVSPILDYVNFLSKTIAGFDFKKAAPVEAVKRAEKPILFLHGGADDFVPVFMGEELYGACSSEVKYFRLIPGSIHARGYQTNPELCESVVEKFLAETVGE